MNIANLEAYVESENSWARIFNPNAQPLSLLNKADRQKIAESIDARLSPENLTCDGELTRAQVNARYRSLMRCAEELRSIDSTVTFYEA